MPTTSQFPPAIMTQYEAARYLRVSTTTLRKVTKPLGPIPCIRVNPRCVRYTLAALQVWIDGQQSGDGCHDSRSATNGS
jgi:hypothetical protein